MQLIHEQPPPPPPQKEVWGEKEIGSSHPYSYPLSFDTVYIEVMENLTLMIALYASVSA